MFMLRSWLTVPSHAVDSVRFGENDVFRKITWFEAFRQRLSRKWKVSIALFRGQGCTLLPFQVPITVVLGRPLQVVHFFPSPTAFTHCDCHLFLAFADPQSSSWSNLPWSCGWVPAEVLGSTCPIIGLTQTANIEKVTQQCLSCVGCVTGTVRWTQALASKMCQSRCGVCIATVLCSTPSFRGAGLS